MLVVDTVNLAKIIKLTYSTDSVTLQPKNDPSNLKITFERVKIGKCINYNLKLLKKIP